MLTLKQVNREIQKRGWNVELIKDKDHFYVFGDDVDYAYSTTIGVYRINHLTIEQWMTRIQSIVDDSKERSPK